MAQQDIEERLQKLEDTEEIKKLMWNYTYWLDYGELDKVLDCFFDEAVIDIKMRGGEEVGEAPLEGIYEGKDMIEGFYRLVVPPKDRFAVAHLLLNPVVTVDGDKAQGIFYLLEPSGIVRAMWGQGRYDMEFVKVDGKWKISRFNFLWNFNTPHDEGWVNTQIALI